MTYMIRLEGSIKNSLGWITVNYDELALISFYIIYIIINTLPIINSPYACKYRSYVISLDTKFVFEYIVYM